MKKRKNKSLGMCHKTTETMGKHYKRKSKKRLSEAQKKALAKGRKVLNYIRTGRRVSEPKEPLLIKEGFLMAKKKRKLSAKQKAALARGRKKAHQKRKHHATNGMAGGGATRHHKKHATVRHMVVYRGGDPGPDIAGLGIDVAGLFAGAIGLSLIASIIPVKNSKIKALIPVAAGITGLFFPQVAENRFGSRAALGALTIGGYSLLKQFAPKIPLMGATDTAEGIGAAIEALPDEEKAILGILPEQMDNSDLEGTDDPDADQDVSDVMGATEMIEGVPGEMLGSYPGEMLGSEPGEMLGDTEMIGATETIGDDASDFE